MVLLTAATGLYLALVAVEPRWSLWLLIGTVLVVAGANALTYLERDIDGRAQRTRNRPLPAGRACIRRWRCGPALCSLAARCRFGVRG